MHHRWVKGYNVITKILNFETPLWLKGNGHTATHGKCEYWRFLCICTSYTINGSQFDQMTLNSTTATALAKTGNAAKLNIEKQWSKVNTCFKFNPSLFCKLFMIYSCHPPLISHLIKLRFRPRSLDCRGVELLIRTWRVIPWDSLSHF